MKKRFLLILSIFLLVLTGLVFAAIPCSTDYFCQLYSNSTSYSCVKGYCVLNSNSSITNTTNTTNNTVIKNTTNNTNVYSPLIETVSKIGKKVNNLSADNERNKKKINNLTNKLSDLDAEIKNIKTNQKTLQDNLNKASQSTNTVSTGLASLQKDVVKTKTDVNNISSKVDVIEKSSSLTKQITYFLLFLVVFAGVVIFIVYWNNKKPQINKELKEYLLKNLAQGKQYPFIKKQLVGSGWDEKQIDFTYEKILDGKKKSSGSKFKGDKEKMLIIGIVAVIVILGLVFLVQKGVSSGKAIYFKEGMELQDFKPLVKGTISGYFTKNNFYPTLPSVDLCIQVMKDPYEGVSYHIVKSGSAYAIREAVVSCDNSEKYDFAVKFNSWDDFSKLTKSISCENFKKIHSTKGMYVLPSEYVLKGFKLNQNESYAKFCSTLSQCLTSTEIKLMGINC